MRRRWRCSLLRRALIWATITVTFTSTGSTAFECPSDTNAPAAHTLTMQCFGACSNANSPCLYYADASACSSSDDDDNTSGSECVIDSTGSGCAIKCLSPFSGAGDSDWNLMVTTSSEYKRDVAAREAWDKDFHLAKEPFTELAKISDLIFPYTTTTISISGNALPIMDKAVDLTVIGTGDTVDIDINYEVFANATGCSTIVLENINLTSLKSLPELPNLETLFLANGVMPALPTGLTDLTSLTTLDISSNLLVTIPTNSLPTTLVSLSVADCTLGTLPSDIMKMPQLKKLDLSYNKFALPPANSIPLTLEHFVYWGQSHTSLPPDVKQMSSLKILEIGWNTFTDASVLNDLPRSLEQLHAVKSSLTEIPTDFYNLTNLTFLDLAADDISELSAYLPPNLQILNMSYNLLSAISEGTLPHTLQYLNLSLNYLTCESFPADFGDLKSLTHLYLDGNNFLEIPTPLFKLTNLQVLSLQYNTNMTGMVSFTADQVEFLNNLTTFLIDEDNLITYCDDPVMVHNYTVCLTESLFASSSSSSSDSDNDNQSPFLYVVIAAVVAVAIGVTSFLWKTQHFGNNKIPPDPHNNSLHTLDKESYLPNMFCFEDARDRDDILGSTMFSSGISHAASATNHRFISIWDDEELLKWRIDFQQIHDQQLLATGFYGEVWLATYLNKPVAVKRLKQSLPSGSNSGSMGSGHLNSNELRMNRSVIQLFVSEIKVHSRFDHPKIVAFIGVAWTMEYDIQVVLEYMAQGDLQSFFANQIEYDKEPHYDYVNSYWNGQSLQIALDITEALVYLHSLDPPVLHRDLKSRNVLLDNRFNAKISDFGISRYQDEYKLTMTTGLGTARWAAPEMLAGNDKYTEAVDIYSLGVILSELDTFRLPFAEHDIPESALLSRVAAGELKPKFSKGVPLDIIELAEQCLAYDAYTRPTAVHVAYMLRQFAVKYGQESVMSSSFSFRPTLLGSERSSVVSDNSDDHERRR